MKRRRPLPLTAIRAFEAAGRLGRMTAAADELAVTHGAISRQVQHLEKVLGIALFAGPRTKPQLTSAGQALLPALSAAFDQIDAAVQAVTSTEDAILDVSCLSTFLMRWLIPRLHGFHDQCPNVDIRLRATEQSGVARSEQFDVIITADEFRPTTAGQKEYVLFKEWLGPVVTPELRRARHLNVPSDLPAELLIETKSRLNAWSMWCNAAAMPPITPAGAMFEHYFYTLEAANAGLGVCIAPWHLVISDIETGGLEAPFGFVESGYSYVAKPRLPSNARIDQFCEWLAKEATGMAMPGTARSRT